ncbi:hypothetical protein SKAU_G00258670 [Synaphobranchus kaupii]|uniref:Uncharacterized protein n=1 Tax=Synaphobranchus kaupii TaxID=118154 RepID=A0A9Q1ISN1_SYNKA|nr:hypothetical protein SKAU_G00258670 [Synaphobranchus kaupii]
MFSPVPFAKNSLGRLRWDIGVHTRPPDCSLRNRLNSHSARLTVPRRLESSDEVRRLGWGRGGHFLPDMQERAVSFLWAQSHNFPVPFPDRAADGPEKGALAQGSALAHRGTHLYGMTQISHRVHDPGVNQTRTAASRGDTPDSIASLYQHTGAP